MSLGLLNIIMLLYRPHKKIDVHNKNNRCLINLTMSYSRSHTKIKKKQKFSNSILHFSAFPIKITSVKL